MSRVFIKEIKACDHDCPAYKSEDWDDNGGGSYTHCILYEKEILYNKDIFPKGKKFPVFCKLFHKTETFENIIMNIKEKKNEEKELICSLCGKRMVRHIIQEGARFHVHGYDTLGVHCSEKDCEDNHGYGKCVPYKYPKVPEWIEDFLIPREEI